MPIDELPDHFTPGDLPRPRCGRQMIEAVGILPVVGSPGFSARRPDFISMAITSRLRGECEYAEVAVDDCPQAGLLEPSAEQRLNARET